MRLWTINALANELDIDRRTLAKRLRDLLPAETEKRKNGSIIRRWRLADVVAHLSRVVPSATEETPPPATVRDLVTGSVYPQIVELSLPMFTGAMINEMGMTRAQALRSYQLLGFAIYQALSAAFQDEGLSVVMPPTLTEISQLGIDEFVRRKWPE